MALMETIKFMLFYGLEVIVVALVGVTLFAGLYQFIREKRRTRSKVEQSHIYTPATAPEKIRRFIDR